MQIKMLWSVLKNIVISILIIYIAHSGWNYILDVCTPKKKKNLVQIQNEKYTAIIERLNKETHADHDDSLGLGMTEEEMEDMRESLLHVCNDEIKTN